MKKNKIFIVRGSTKVETKDSSMASTIARDIFDDMLYEHPNLPMTISDGDNPEESVEIRAKKFNERWLEATFTFSEKSVFADHSGERSQYDGEDLIVNYISAFSYRERGGK